MTQLCDACGLAESDTTFLFEYETVPCHLCEGCHDRLMASALRPIEWFNLAKRYGCTQAPLHDDMYEDDGTATQPDYPVDSPELFPMPTLEDVSGDPQTLLDFTITQWSLNEDIINAWQQLSGEDVVPVLSSRFAQSDNPDINSQILEVACIFSKSAEALVRDAWHHDPKKVHLYSLAKATARCMPCDEGLDRVIDALNHCPENQKHNTISALEYFHSPRVLDWIQTNISSPVTGSWGWLAAASQLDWARAAKWIELGKPLSLVALDALIVIIRPQPKMLAECTPRLLHAPDAKTLTDTLAHYALLDPSPRVKKDTAFIIANVDVLLR